MDQYSAMQKYLEEKPQEGPWSVVAMDEKNKDK